MKLYLCTLCMFCAALLLFAGCEPSAPNSPDRVARSATPASLQKAAVTTTESAPPDACVRMLGTLNTKLKMVGKKYRIAKMEYITAPGSGEYGSTVFAKDVGNKQLSAQFVPALLFYPGYFTYIVDDVEGTANGGLTNADTEPAIDRAMQTWDNVVGSGLTLTKLPSPGYDLGVVQYLLGFGGSPVPVAEAMHAGWLPADFFDAIEPPDGHLSIIGVTFTFIWVDENGNPLDTNGDHFYDAAFRETYYNNYFLWTNQVVDWTSPLIDVETIVLHESGHLLSQAHFGMIFNDGKGTAEPGFQLNHLHFSPRAVMNAIYWDTQRTLLGSDVAGHLSIWATWPKF